MEDYETKVANLQATQSQNSSKFTGETTQERTPEGTTADFLPTRATTWILYFLERRNLQKNR